MGPLHRCLGRPHVPWYHRSLPHVHSKLHASCESSHHVNSQEPAIRLRSRADIRTGRPLTSLNRITCAPPDRLHFDFIRDPCSQHIPNRHRIPSLSMFNRRSSEAVLCAIRFHHPQRSRIVLLAAEVGVIWPLPMAPCIKAILHRHPKSSH